MFDDRMLRKIGRHRGHNYACYLPVYFRNRTIEIKEDMNLRRIERNLDRTKMRTYLAPEGAIDEKNY